MRRGSVAQMVDWNFVLSDIDMDKDYAYEHD